MIVQNKEIWSLLLKKINKKGEMTIIRYYPFISGPLGEDSFVAEDEVKKQGAIGEIDPGASKVVKMVELILSRATSLAGMPRDNKTSVMCQFRKRSGEVVTVYFSHYESQRVISERIRSSSLGIPVPS